MATEIATGANARRVISPSRPTSPVAVAASTMRCGASKLAWLPETFCDAAASVSGSHASLLAPQRIVLAATATGLVGREGEITRLAVAPVAIAVAILAVIGMVA